MSSDIMLKYFPKNLASKIQPNNNIYSQQNFHFFFVLISTNKNMFRKIAFNESL